MTSERNESFTKTLMDTICSFSCAINFYAISQSGFRACFNLHECLHIWSRIHDAQMASGKEDQ